MRLTGRVVIVTGAGRGLGLAYAERLAQEGATVVMADLLEPSADVEALCASSASVRYVKTDVRSESQVKELVKTAVAEFGRIDVLINNAAIFCGLKRTPFEELTTQQWEEVLGVNVIGSFLCARAVVPVMKSQESGKIINIGSNVDHKGLPMLLHYVASKGAVHAMTRALASELGPFGITVNAVAPGYVMHEGTARTDEGRNDKVVALRALGKTQTPNDLMGIIVFLASAESDFITGQTVVVDGGEVFS